MLAIRIKTLAKPQLTIASGLLYFGIALYVLPGYLLWDANLFTGLVLAPFICKADASRFSSRYLFPALLTLVLAVLLPVKTMLFIALLFAILLFVENSLGRLSDAFLFLLFLISPVFKYLIAMVDFPVRLWLTGRVAALLSTAGIKATAAGNQVHLSNCDFSVDPACAGLNMLIISLILCLFVFMHFQRQTGKHLRFIYLALFFMATIGLNVICNFFRILLLVAFKIMPGTFFHNFVGVACLAIYVVTPLVAGVKPLLNSFGRARPVVQPPAAKFGIHAIKYQVLHCLFAITLLFIAFNVINADKLVPTGKTIRLAGFNSYQMTNGITRLYNKDALIYLKPTVFYAPEHDPKICWTGSGYQFTAIKKEKIGGVDVYTGTLEKGRDKIYAAWWFDNGDTKTTDQLQWRWDAVKGNHPFYLINVNTSNPQSLKEEVAGILANHALLK